MYRPGADAFGGEQAVDYRGSHPIAPLAQGSPDRFAAESIFPETAQWWGVFARLGLTHEQAVSVAAAAERNGTSVKAKLLALEYASEETLAQAMADELGLLLQKEVDPDSLVLPDRQAAALLTTTKHTVIVRVTDGVDAKILVDTSQPGKLAGYTGSLPGAAQKVRLVTTGTLRRSLVERLKPVLSDVAAFDLFKRHPAYSARTVVNAWQGCVAGALAIGVPAAMWTWPAATFGALHVVFTLFFLSCVALRFAALAGSGEAATTDPDRPFPADLPIYSVLVALYKEAEIAGDLVAALRKLDWPASKLDIKLVCEADDNETIAAIRAACPPPHMQIVEVPNHGPRTKPKALNYAMQSCRGAFVVLYDAEDRPHPRQLVEAWHRFQARGPEVACLQAPLQITNGRASWIARSFAFEYDALFRGLLPWLSKHGLLLPLGGTSNHFRRDVLDAVGKWDPFNVTEDADLGARLLRFGYRTETISLPTLEEAPELARIWISQRTLWFKGWCPSLLVHTRRPAAVYREIGPRSFGCLTLRTQLAHTQLHGHVARLAFRIPARRFEVVRAVEEPITRDQARKSVCTVLRLLETLRAEDVHRRSVAQVRRTAR